MSVIVPSKMAATSASVWACCLSGLISRFGKRTSGSSFQLKGNKGEACIGLFSGNQNTYSDDGCPKSEDKGGGEETGTSQATSVI